MTSMSSSDAERYTAETTYPACYRAASEAYAAGADDDTAYRAAQDAAEECTRACGNNAALQAMTAAYEATMAARAERAAAE
jgi:hypothetical protein